MGPLRSAPGQGSDAQPAQRPESLDIGSFLPGHARRQLDESAALRRDLDRQASLRLAPAAPKSTAERRRTAAKFSKVAANLREAGRMAESLHPLQQAIAANPDDADLHFDLGLTLVRCLRHPEAVAPLQRAIELKPEFGKAYYALALAYDAVGRNLDAIAALRRAAEYAPKLADAHMMLGTLLHRIERLEEARQSFHRAAVAGRNTTAGRIAESFVLTESGKLAEAAEVLRQALKRDPTNDMAHLALGHVLSNMGDIDGATAEFERTPKLLGDQVAAWAALLQIKKLTEADGHLIAAMETHLERERLIPQHRLTLHFALGKAYDDLQDYAHAIQHYDAANRIRRQLHPFSRDMMWNVRKQVDITIAKYTPDFFVGHRGDGLEDETAILVLGMPRSGTTLVEQVLSSHPRVAAAGELTFWRQNAATLLGTPSKVADPAMARRLAEEYLALLRSISTTATRVVDKALFNFFTIGLVLQALPRTRIVHCRRNPIDTCLSMYFTNFETITDFVADRDDLVFYYREYQRLMGHWRAILSPEQFIEMDYEEIVAEPETSARKLIEFSSLEWDPACLRPEDNQRTVKTASVWQVRQPIYRNSLERWRRYEPWLGSLRELMPPES